MTQMRMLIQGDQSLIGASSCSTNLYVPPGANSAWLDITHTPTNTHRVVGALSLVMFLTVFLYTGNTHNCTAVAVQSWNSSAPKNAVRTSLAPFHTHPPTCLCLSVAFTVYQEAHSYRTHKASEADSPS